MGTVKQDYWTVLKAIGNDKSEKLSFQVRKLIAGVEESAKVHSLQGKGRLLIRSALQFKLLSEIILHLVRNMPHSLSNCYNEQTSILANEILCEIFISLLIELEQVNFCLNLENSSFLDESWFLPVYRCYEFVRCQELGIGTAYAKGRVVVKSLASNGVAAEEDKICVGDILDQVDEVHLYNCPRGQVLSLFRAIQTAPIKVSVVKCLTDENRVFTPIIPILNELKLDGEVGERIKLLAAKKELESESSNKPADLMQNLRFDKRLRFVGKSCVGLTGTTASIDAGMAQVFARNETETQMVSIDIGDAYLTITNVETQVELFRHSYTRIGSCGKRVDDANHFCYIVGETTCNIAKEFQCFVFEASDAEQANAILHAIEMSRSARVE